MPIHDENYLRIQRLYDNADKYVGINHKLAAEKFQLFGHDVMKRLAKINLQKMILVRKSKFLEYLSKALLHYIEFAYEPELATDMQIIAFFRTKDGKVWFSNLKYCVWKLTGARNKSAHKAARALFIQHIDCSRRQKLESRTEIKAFVAYIHFLAKQIKNTNVIKLDFNTGRKI